MQVSNSISIWNNPIPTIYSSSSFENLNSVDFDGVNEKITVTDDATLDITNDLSLTAWIKTTSTATDGVLTKYPTNANKSYYLGLRSSGQLYCVISSDGNTTNAKAYYTTSATVNDDAWHFICATFTSGTLKLYIDGTEITSVTKLIDGTCNSIYSGTADVEIGTANSLYYVGKVDNAAIWDTTVLSSLDISTLYNSGVPTDLEAYGGSANLVSWWPLGEGSDDETTFADRIGSNTGTGINLEAGDIQSDIPT